MEFEKEITNKEESVPDFYMLNRGVVDVSVSLGQQKIATNLALQLRYLLVWLKPCKDSIPKDIGVKTSEIYKKYREFLVKDLNMFAGAPEEEREFIVSLSELLDDPRIHKLVQEQEVLRKKDKSPRFNFQEFRRLIDEEKAK